MRPFGRRLESTQHGHISQISWPADSKTHNLDMQGGKKLFTATDARGIFQPESEAILWLRSWG